MGSSKQRTTDNVTQNQSSSQQQSSAFNQGNQGSSWTSFDPRTASEQAILSQYQNLGSNQQEFLNQLMSGASPYTMNAEDQALINQSFAGAKDRLMTGGKEYADYLATTRGLNKSDTPVSLQAMDRFGLSLGDLESQRARALLDYGLQGTNMRLMGAQALPAGLGAAMMPMFNERMAGGRNQFYNNVSGSNQSSGTSQANMSGRSDSTTTNTPSLMDQIGKGLQLGAGLGMMAGGAMMGNPMMGMGGLGLLGGGGNPFLTSMGNGGGGLGSLMTNNSGMGSGAAANASFYDPRYGYNGPK